MELKGEEEQKLFFFVFLLWSSHMLYQSLILMNYLDFGGEAEDDYVEYITLLNIKA